MSDPAHMNDSHKESFSVKNPHYICFLFIFHTFNTDILPIENEPSGRLLGSFCYISITVYVSRFFFDS